MTKTIICDLDSCLAAADEMGGCSHRRLRRSARPTMAVSRRNGCGRRSPSAGASRSMPSPTNTETMRAAGWKVFRQTELTGPMYDYGDLAGRICRCSGFWLRPVFGGCSSALHGFKQVLIRDEGRILILPPTAKSREMERGTATSAARSTSACNVAAETSNHLRAGEPAATRRVALRSRIPTGFRPKAQGCEAVARHELPCVIVRPTSPTATRLRPIRSRPRA